MPNITSLTPATLPLSGPEVIPIVQDGHARSVVVGTLTDSLAAEAQAAATAAGVAQVFAETAQELAETAQTAAETAETNAEAAQAAAEVAMAQSYAANRVFTSSAAGQASGTLVSGDYFYVISASSASVYELWQKGASSPTDTEKRVPSNALVTALTLQARSLTPFGARVQWPTSEDAPSGYFKSSELLVAQDDWEYISRYLDALLIDGTVGAVLDPMVLSTLFQDAAGSTPVAADGDPVMFVADGSINGHNASMSDAAAAPTYRTSGGLSWVEFTATQYLTVPQAAIGSTATVEIISCFALDAAGASPTILSPLNSGVGAYQMFQTTGRIPRVAVTGGTGGTTIANAPWAAVLGERNVYGARVDATTMKAYVNETETGSVARVGTYGAPASYRLGFNGTVGTGITGKWFGSIIVRKTLTALQRAMIYRYFYARANVYRSIFVGDSTSDEFPLGTVTKLSTLMGTRWQELSLAAAGNTIAQQKTAWQSRTVGKSAKYVNVFIGHNDLNSAVSTATTIAALQDLVTTIAADVGPHTKIIVMQMIPCRQRLINLYGSTNGALSYQKLLDINAAIAGEGATPITGVHGRVTSHYAQLDDGTGALKAAYDTGDGIHWNDAGRAIGAAAITAVVESLGLSV